MSRQNPAPSRKFVDLQPIDISSHDQQHEDPYLDELLDVLDKVETEGEQYLERLIVQAGLDFSTPSQSNVDHVQAVDRTDKTSLKTKPGKLPRPEKFQKTKMGIVEPASDDNYRNLYGTYKNDGDDLSPDESETSGVSSTSTENVAESLARMIARGEPPNLDDQDADHMETYGTKLIPYVSFNERTKDLGMTKPAKSHAVLLAVHGVEDTGSPDDLGEAGEKHWDDECFISATSEDVLSADFSEDFYDEGKSQTSFGKQKQPEMVLLSDSSDDGEDLGPPGQYYEYNQKESQCLAIVANFRRQFADAYPDRKPLFLTPVNEVGVPRFVCTTIRPTIFSFDELFQWDGIARFFSYQLEYILLNPPDMPPAVVTSPSFILKERQGNCFDYCFIIASVLIGVGYDAYIVNGYAAASICCGDESKRICPLLPVDKEPEIIPEYEKEFNLSVMQSELANELFKDTIQRQRKAKIKERNESVKGLEYLLQQEKFRAGVVPHSEDSQSEDEEIDPYEARRVHAWVVVLPGKRDVTEPFFIEPITGRAFAVNHGEFFGLESVWNHRQLYVNMQQPSEGETLLWDLNDQQKWEPIFTEQVLPKKPKNCDAMGVDSEILLNPDGCTVMPQNSLDAAKSQCEGPGWPFRGFEMPRPWSEPLTISKRRYLRFCKNGYRLHRYLKCDLEYYHHYERKDGLINKFILFKNRRKTHITHVKEVYENRRDRLKYRKHTILDGVLCEYFAPGHLKSIKMHQVHIRSEKPPKFSELYRALNSFKVAENVVRLVTYYSEYRNDNLRLLEQHTDEIFWHYEDRKDRLVFRSLKYGNQIDRSYAVEALKCKGDQHPIAVIMEKFDRNPEVEDPDWDIYMREFDVNNNKLSLVYQPGDGLVMSTQRNFVLPDFNEIPQAGSEIPNGYLRMNEDVMTAIFRDQLREEHRMPIDIWDEMVKNYKLSLQAILQVRRAEENFKEEIHQRIEEEQYPVLWHSVYDVERHPRAAAILKKAQETIVLQQHANKEEPSFDPVNFDWLSPYMAAYGSKDIKNLEDAVAIRQTMLDDLRERLLYTANALQKAYEEELSKLQTLNEKFRKAQVGEELSPKDFTVYEKHKTAIQFKMHMLERRQELLQFEGPAKLKRTNEWILKDPRFSVWLQGLQLETPEHIVEDELMGVKKRDPHWSPAKRKKVWTLDSDDGDITVEPIAEVGEQKARGDASWSKLV